MASTQEPDSWYSSGTAGLRPVEMDTFDKVRHDNQNKMHPMFVVPKPYSKLLSPHFKFRLNVIPLF